MQETPTICKEVAEYTEEWWTKTSEVLRPTCFTSWHWKYKPQEPRYQCCFNCDNDGHLADQCCFCVERERDQREKPEVKKENDSDSNIPPPLVPSDKDQNESTDQEPKDEKDEKQKTEVDETIGAVTALKT